MSLTGPFISFCSELLRAINVRSRGGSNGGNVRTRRGLLERFVRGKGLKDN